MSHGNPAVRRCFLRVLQRDIDKSIDINLCLAEVAWLIDDTAEARAIYQRTIALDGTKEEQQEAQCMARFTEDLLDGRCNESVRGQIERQEIPDPTRGPLVVTLVSSRYMEMFRLWAAQAKKHLAARIVVMALDEESESTLAAEFDCNIIRMSQYFVFGEDKRIGRYCRRNIWMMRVLLLQELVARGYEVISLDLDAIIVGDVAGMLASFMKTDIVAQKDYSIPVDAARKLGFIVCCGFMVIRSNTRAIAFMERYRLRTNRELDDQLGLNHLLVAEGLSSRTRQHGHMTFECGGVSWACPDEQLVSRDVHFGTVIRHFQQHGQSMEQLRNELGLS